MTDKRQQAIDVSVDDLKLALEYFGATESEETHYQTMRTLVDPVIDTLPQDRVPDDLTTFRIHWMFAVSAWNKRSYQSNKRDPLDHFHRIDAPFSKHWVSMMSYRQRNIQTLIDDDQQKIMAIYGDFRPILGPVGTAKGLHLFAPYFFCPWDTRIYNGYGLDGYKSSHYWQFLRQTQRQIECLKDNFGDENPIKAIDRFNFWHFTCDRGKK